MSITYWCCLHHKVLAKKQKKHICNTTVRNLPDIMLNGTTTSFSKMQPYSFYSDTVSENSFPRWKHILKVSKYRKPHIEIKYPKPKVIKDAAVFILQRLTKLPSLSLYETY